jgi:hypothetical protein
MPANVRVYEITKLLFIPAARVNSTDVGGQMKRPEMGM